MTIFKAARVAALMAGGSVLLAATPSLAQGTRSGQPQSMDRGRDERPVQGQAPAQAQAQSTDQQVVQRRFNALSRGERGPFGTLINAAATALQAKASGQSPDMAPVQAALPAAQAVAKSNEAKLFVAQIQLELALNSGNSAGQEQALTALLASPILLPSEQTQYRRMQAILLEKRAEQAFAAKDFASAERLYRQLLQTNPTEQRLLNNLRIVQQRQGNTAGAQQGLEQQIAAAEASGQRAPETAYQQAVQVALQGNRRSDALAATQRLLRHYPNAANWRRAVDFLRAGTGQDNQLLLDVYRFARAANALQPSEYVALATTLDQGGLSGEAKAVLDAGVAAGVVRTSDAQVARVLGTANRRIAEDRAGLAGQIQQARSASNGRQARLAADALVGYGRYAEAAELYRLALSKGGDDANLVNIRLGASLAMAGQRAEAEAALRAVTGSRADLAALWLAWLGRSQS